MTKKTSKGQFEDICGTLNQLLTTIENGYSIYLYDVTPSESDQQKPSPFNLRQKTPENSCIIFKKGDAPLTAEYVQRTSSDYKKSSPLNITNQEGLNTLITQKDKKDESPIHLSDDEAHQYFNRHELLLMKYNLIRDYRKNEKTGYLVMDDGVQVAERDKIKSEVNSAINTWIDDTFKFLLTELKNTNVLSKLKLEKNLQKLITEVQDKAQANNKLELILVMEQTHRLLNGNFDPTQTRNEITNYALLANDMQRKASSQSRRIACIMSEIALYCFITAVFFCVVGVLCTPISMPLLLVSASCIAGVGALTVAENITLFAGNHTKNMAVVNAMDDLVKEYEGTRKAM